MSKRLVELGANPRDLSLLFSTVTSENSTPEKLKIIKVLLRYHRDINSLTYDGNTILSNVENIEILKLLLALGVDWRKGYEKCIIALLNASADVNEKDEYGRTPLDVGSDNSKEIIKKWIVHCVRMKFLLRNHAKLLSLH